MTDEQLAALWPNVRFDISEGRDDVISFARAVLAADARPSAQVEAREGDAGSDAFPAKWQPKPVVPLRVLVSDAEYLRLFEEARKGSDRPCGVIRGIRACIAAYELATPPTPPTATTEAATLPAEMLTEEEADDIWNSAECNPDDRGWGPEFDIAAYTIAIQRAFATKNGIGITPKAEGEEK